MKRIVIFVIAATVLGYAAWTARWLFAQARATGTEPAVERPAVRDLVDKTVASGRIVPVREISVKSRVSGVVERVFVAPGQRVRRGDPLVTIEPVPDEVQLSELRGRVSEARIDHRWARRELRQTRQLAASGVVARRAVAEAERELELRGVALRVADERLRLVRDGGTGAAGHKGSVVRATADGTVMAVPVELGQHVIETSPHGDGTTLASIADLDDIVFVGHVDEADAGALRVGMSVEVRVAALSDRVFSGRLEFIAPQSRSVDGPTTFEIRASVAREDADAVLRAGYSANAEIVLARAERALCVREAVLRFDRERAFVDVVGVAGLIERREVRPGLSDGIYVEIVAGLAPEDAVRVPVSEVSP